VIPIGGSDVFAGTSVPGVDRLSGRGTTRRGSRSPHSLSPYPRLKRFGCCTSEARVKRGPNPCIDRRYARKTVVFAPLPSMNYRRKAVVSSRPSVNIPIVLVLLPLYLVITPACLVSLQEDIVLEPLLGSTNAERVLVFLLARNEGYASEMARFFETDLYGIQKQLDKLETAGVLASRNAGRTRLYRFNPRYSFLQELQALLTKALSFYPDEERERLTVVRRRPRRRGKPL